MRPCRFTTYRKESLHDYCFFIYRYRLLDRTAHCSGRYQLRLPSQRHHGSTHIDYNGWSVMVMFNDWDRNVRTINRFKRSGYDGTDIVVDTRTLIPDQAMMQVTRKRFFLGTQHYN